MYDKNCIYFPMSSRLVIPATTTVNAPYIVTVQAQGLTLEYIEFSLPQAGVLQDLGVKIRTNDGVLYPALGSASDGTFQAGNKDSWGHLPTSGTTLLIPFNRRLPGVPNTITFEFYNDGAGTVAVNIMVVTSLEKIKLVEVKTVEDKERVDPVKYPQAQKVK